MKAQLFCASLAATLLTGALASFAQAPQGSSESPHCNTMTASEKEQCLRDEAEKTQGPRDSASAGGTRAPDAMDPRLGRSPHCDTMTGDEKVKCLEAEARKDENPPASKSAD